MAAERRCGWPGDFHQRAVRTRCRLNQNSYNLHGPESPCLRISRQSRGIHKLERSFGNSPTSSGRYSTVTFSYGNISRELATSE
jgi:hypothetical protein